MSGLLKILIIRNIPTYMEIRGNTYNIQEIGLAKALVRKGQTCDVLFWTDKEEETVLVPAGDAKSVQVFYRRGRSFLKNAVFLHCEELYAGYDVLQPCEINQLQAWILAGQYPDKTIIYHGPYYDRFNRRYNMLSHVTDLLFLGRYQRRGTRFLAKSVPAKEYLVSKGIADGNICITGVGIDTQMLENRGRSLDADSAEEEKTAFCETMGRDGSPLRLLYIGRLEERRNIPFLIDIFREVLQKEPGARLYMIGTGESRYVEMCLQYMEKANVRDRIVLQERMEQRYLGDIYRLADFFLLPTRYEIFGMVLLEAMYYGNVVLTTPNGGSGTLIHSKENGLILDSADPAFWAEQIFKLNQNPEEKRRIGESAHRTIAEHFTWDMLAEVFLAQYRLVGK